MLAARNFWEEHTKPLDGVPMLFVHVPKCGGKYVMKAFGKRSRRCISLTEPCLSGHLRWQQYRNRMALLGQEISRYRTFAVVRNPFDWHVSWFNYIRNDGGGRRSGYAVEHTLFRTMVFSDYVAWLQDPDAERSPQFDMGRQLLDWVVDEEGTIAVDHVLRQERLNRDLQQMAARHGVRLRLPQARVNTSRAGDDYRSYYGAGDVDAIARRHADDLRVFGYRFE